MHFQVGGSCLFPGGYVSIPKPISISHTVVGVIDGLREQIFYTKWWFLEYVSNFHLKKLGKMIPHFDE